MSCGAPKSSKYRVGAERFSSLVEIQRACQTILKRAPKETKLVGRSGDFVRALLNWHPRSAQKLARGCQGVVVVGCPSNNGWRPHKRFAILTDDGQLEPFSYRQCINRRSNTQRQKAMKALRRAVKEQVDDFRRRAMATDPTCQISGRALSWGDAGDVHVDHKEPSFVELADSWAAAQKTSVAELPIAKDGGGVWTIANERLVDDWRRWHGERATLQLAHARANLSKGSSSKTLNTARQKGDEPG